DNNVDRLRQRRPCRVELQRREPCTTQSLELPTGQNESVFDRVDRHLSGFVQTRHDVRNLRRTQTELQRERLLFEAEVTHNRVADLTQITVEQRCESFDLLVKRGGIKPILRLQKVVDLVG